MLAGLNGLIGAAAAFRPSPSLRRSWVGAFGAVVNAGASLPLIAVST